MLKNNIEIDVKEKCVEEQTTQAELTEKTGTSPSYVNRLIKKPEKIVNNIKVAFDIAYIVVSAAICLLFTGKLSGVREGSIAAALLVGNIIRIFNNLFDRIFGKQIQS